MSRDTKMSEDKWLAWMDTKTWQYIAPLPYPVCDTHMNIFASNITGNEFALKIERYTISSGSCSYHVEFIPPDASKIGRIYLYQGVDPNTTVFLLLPEIKVHQQTNLFLLRILVGNFWRNCYANIEKEPDFLSIETIPIRENETVADAIAEVRAERVQRPTRPSTDDPIDAWLDWRERERKKPRGERLTLEDIAQVTGKSIATVKKYSALRKPRGKK
jgi:hypothetical protein